MDSNRWALLAALGEAGSTVICTGRSSAAHPGWSDYDRSETIEETAELVTSLGGTGIAIQVDHLDPEQVRRLAERIRNQHGRIDVLVNDIWGLSIWLASPLSGIPRSGSTILTRASASSGSAWKPT